MTAPVAPMSVVPEEQTSPPSGRSGRLADLALRVAGGVVAVFGGVLAGVLELMLAVAAWEIMKGQPTPGSRLLVGVVAALGGLAVVIVMTVALSWFAHAAVGTRWATALPALPWFVLVVFAAVRTAEGDLLLGGDNLLGLGLIVTGAITFAVMAFRQLLVPLTQPVRPPAIPGGVDGG